MLLLLNRQGQRAKNVFFFLLNSPSSKAIDVASPNLAAAIMGNASCDPDPKVKVSGQILYLIANASPSEPVDTSTSNFRCAYFKYVHGK